MLTVTLPAHCTVAQALEVEDWLEQHITPYYDVTVGDCLSVSHPDPKVLTRVFERAIQRIINRE